MADTKKEKEEATITGLVDKIVKDLKQNGSSRYSEADFHTLVYGVLSDPTFKAKKYMIRGEELIESEETGVPNAAMKEFLNKLLKHAGMQKAEERQAVIDSFQYGVNDIKWITDAVQEAMWIYSHDCQKPVTLFSDKIRKLSFREMVRTGKYEGKVGYKKVITDKKLQVEAKKAKAAKAAAEAKKETKKKK